MSNDTERDVLKETLQRAAQRQGPACIHDAEPFYGATYGEILGCCYCGAQIRVDYQVNEDKTCTPTSFVFLNEGLPEYDEGTETYIHTPPLHVCLDCFRVLSGLTEEDIASIIDDRESRINSGADEPIALSEACQVWAARELPISGNEPEVWIEIEEQVKEWMDDNGMEDTE